MPFVIDKFKSKNGASVYTENIKISEINTGLRINLGQCLNQML